MNIFSGSISDYLLLILFAIISVSASIYLYNKSELSKYIKATLITLRAVSLFLILSLLLNPFIEYFKNISEKPPNIILIDESFSMSLEQNDSAKTKVLKELTSGRTDFRIYSFGSNVIKEISDEAKDTVINYKYSSNLATTLDGLKNYNFQRINSISIISDGLINEGNNLLQVARSLKAPIHYVLTGDTVQRKDLVINRLLYNRKNFVNSSSKVIAEIYSYNTDKEIKINLYEDDSKIKTSSVLVSSSRNKYEVVFDIFSSVPGMKKYRLEIEAEPDEVTKINNNDVFYIDFVDNTVKMLVIAGAPSYDVSALRQTLNRSENIKYDIRIQKNNNEFYEGELPKFNEYDIITLIGFPNDKTSRESIEAIKNGIKKSRNALFFFNSSDISFEKVNELKEIFPFVNNGAGKRETKGSIYLTPNKLYQDTENFRKLNSLPSAFYFQEAFINKPNSTVLGLHNSEPAIIADNTSEIRTAAFLGYGFYAWNLKPVGSYEFLQNIISVFIGLCVDENSKDKFTIKTNKDCYAESEPVYFTSVYKEIDPVNKYSVRINVSKSGKDSELQLSQTGENIFQGEMRLFEKGDYKVKADLFENDVLKYSSTTRFSVDEPFKEYRETKAKDNILKEAANVTGGVNLSEKSTKELNELFKSTEYSEVSYPSKTLFRNSIWYLIFILLLLSIEWFIRKRNNLA